jgi:hypothetical protein
MKERLVVCGILYSLPRPRDIHTYRGEATVSLVGNTRPPPPTHSAIFGIYVTVYKVHRGLLNSLMLQSLVPHQLGARTVCNISGVSSQIFEGLSHETYWALFT